MTTPSDTSPKDESAPFDPYHKWLGIPPSEQPPHYYQLIGIALYESDADVIDSAAARQMTHVRQCATGPHAEASQKVLNDLSEAQICLLDPTKKGDYDARLKVKLREETAKSAASEASANQDAKLQQRLRTLDKQKKQAETLLAKSEFARAIDVLEKMAAVKSPKLAKYAKWAKQQLPQARRGPQEMQASTAAIHRTAVGLFDNCDYEEAAGILQQIPKKYRSSETRQLLQECLDLQEELVVLQEDIERAESLKKYEDLLPTVERLLELKPNDRRAKRLRKELKTYGKGGGMRLGGRGDTRFDAAGNTSNPLKTALLVLVPLCLFGGVSWMVYDYVRSQLKTIQIEIDDPTATVSIDDKTIELTGEGDTAKLNVGSHRLKVERDGEVLLTRDFEVVKGKNPVLQISVAEAVAAGPTGTAVDAGNDGPRVFSGHAAAAYAVAMSVDGRRMVTSAGDGTARLWDVATGKEVRQFRVTQSGIIFSVALSRDGKRVVTSGHPDRNNAVLLWDVEAGEAIQQFEGHTKVVQAVAITPDGKTIASGGIDTVVRFWNGDQGGQAADDIQTGNLIVSLLFSNDGKQIYVGHSGKVVAYDIQTGEKGTAFEGFTGSALSAKLSRNGQRLLTSCGDKAVLWNAASGEEIREYTGHTDRIGGVAFLPDEKHIVSGSFDGTVRVWETETGKEIAKFERKDAKHQVRGMTVTPDGRFAVTAGLDAQIRLWPLPASVSGGGSATPVTPKAPIAYSKTVREAAEWVISVGGKVRVGADMIAESSQLPPGDFTVTGVELARIKKVTDRQFPHLLPLKSIRSLGLIGTLIGDESIQVITQFPELRELYIDGTKITRSGLTELAQQPQLTKFFLYGIGLKDEDMQFVTAHTNMGSLTIAGNPITDRAVDDLIQMKKLHTLQIQATGIGDVGIPKLAQLPELKLLYMGSAKISNSSIQEFGKFPKLERLRFYVASIDDNGLDELSKLQNLKEIYLVKTKVTEAGANRLKAAMPKTEIVYEK